MLVFISDELLTPKMFQILRVEQSFITFAIATGKMYKNYKKTFVTEINGARRWGNENVFGAIFSIPNNAYYSRKVDSYYICSLSALRTNHKMDFNHRKLTTVIPIQFNTLQEVSNHTYTLGAEVECWAYYANLQNQGVINTMKNERSRIIEGCNTKSFKELFQTLHKVES